MPETKPVFRWHGTAHQRDAYGQKIIARMPISVVAPTIQDATAAALTAMGATYDDFRKFWSHQITFERADEIDPGESTS